jgi:hypothetical protein
LDIDLRQLRLAREVWKEEIQNQSLEKIQPVLIFSRIQEFQLAGKSEFKMESLWLSHSVPLAIV